MASIKPKKTKRNTHALNQRQRSRYTQSRSKKVNRINKKMLKNNSRRKNINSNQRFKKYKEDITLLKYELDKIKEETYKLHNISKTHLNLAWKKALMNYRRGKYINASKYFLICLLVGMIMLDRHGSYQTAYKTSTSLSNTNAQTLMCGLLNYSKNPKDPVFNHKVITKRNTNRITGPVEHFIKILTDNKILLDGFDESNAEELFDLVYNCRNPHVQDIATYAVYGTTNTQNPNPEDGGGAGSSW